MKLWWFVQFDCNQINCFDSVFKSLFIPKNWFQPNLLCFWTWIKEIYHLTVLPEELIPGLIGGGLGQRWDGLALICWVRSDWHADVAACCRSFADTPADAVTEEVFISTSLPLMFNRPPPPPPPPPVRVQQQPAYNLWCLFISEKFIKWKSDQIKKTSWTDKPDVLTCIYMCCVCFCTS